MDEDTRECLALVAAETCTGSEVRRVLTRVLGRRGAATRMRSDNGRACLCAAWATWRPVRGTAPLPVAPASPWENGFSDSFHSRRRDEFRERGALESVTAAPAPANWWRRDYNTLRPHRRLAYATSQECSDAGDRQQPPGSQRSKS